MLTAINKRHLFLCVLLLWSCHNKRGQLVENLAKPPGSAFSHVYYAIGGPLEPAFAKAQQAVLARYSLSYSSFGCVVTDSLIRAIRQHNDSLFTHLQKRFPGLSEVRLSHEMQGYSQTQKAIERTINPWLKRHIRHCVLPYYYPAIDWTVADSNGKKFLTNVFLYEPKSGKREGPVYVMLVTPATGSFKLKEENGQWTECAK